MDVFKIGGNRPITYEQRNINKKEGLQGSEERLNSEKNNIKQLFAEAPTYDKVHYDSYRQEYFKTLNMSMSSGISSGMEKYEEIYNEITKNTPEGETRDSLYKMLDQAFEGSTALYAEAMSSRIWALSGVKLKVEIPALGTNKMVKPDNSAFNNMSKDRQQMVDEFKNLFSNIHKYFHNNGSFDGITDNKIATGSPSLAINDFTELSGSLMNGLKELEKSGATSDKMSEQVNQSNLSDYAKQLLNDIIQKRNEGN